MICSNVVKSVQVKEIEVKRESYVSIQTHWKNVLTFGLKMLCAVISCSLIYMHSC